MKPFDATDPRYPAYRIKCAELEGYAFDNSGCFPQNTIMRCANGIATHKEDLSTYLNDGSIDRVVRKLDDMQLMQFIEYLDAIVNRGWGSLVLGNPEQKAEALCRVLVGEKGGTK